MKALPLLVALGVATAGCSSIDRSRDLANPKVPPVTTAQQVCSNCHGVDGNSINPTFPKLAQQQDAYIKEQLTLFRAHHRRDPPGYEYMWGITRSLTDAQIKGLAKYFSSQTNTPNPHPNPVGAKRGKQVFEKGIPAKGIPACRTCHGAQGQGNATFPRIAGQHEDYIEKQLNVFQRTNERMPQGAAMKDVAHSLTPGIIRDVARYLASLP